MKCISAIIGKKTKTPEERLRVVYEIGFLDILDLCSFDLCREYKDEFNSAKGDFAEESLFLQYVTEAI